MVPERLQAALAAAPVVSISTPSIRIFLCRKYGLTFLEIDQEADAELTARLYLLNDRQAATAIAHDTVFENYDRVKRVFPSEARSPLTAPLSGSIRAFSPGRLQPSPRLVAEKARSDGANLHLIGVYRGITEEAQLMKSRS